MSRRAPSVLGGAGACPPAVPGAAEELLAHVRYAQADPFGDIVSVTMTRRCAANSWTPGFPGSSPGQTSHRDTARTRRPGTLPLPLNPIIRELG
jgi:hypothetical protein